MQAPIIDLAAQVLDLGDVAEVASATMSATKPWPNTAPEQLAFIRDALTCGATVSAKALAGVDKGVGPEEVEGVLVALSCPLRARILLRERPIRMRAA